MLARLVLRYSGFSCLKDETPNQMVKDMLHQTLDPAQLQSWRDLLSDDEQTSVLRDLIDSFLSESTTHIAALHTCLEAGDIRACRLRAHDLLNGCSVIGARHMMHLCAEMEALANVAPPDLSRLGQHLVQIEEEYKRVVQALEQERP
jgi:HPt (histidine-containing phosphotransfer) domain-containing protein